MTRRSIPRRRPLAWAAAVVLIVVSGIQLFAASVGDVLHDPVAIVSLAIGVVGLVTAARFVTAQCFESRLGMILVGAATLLTVLLIHTVGAPGLPPTGWSVRDAVLALLAAALVLSWRVTARAPRV